MKHSTPTPPDAHDPEALLRSGLRDTTPEFERRWTDLKRDLRREPAPRRGFARHWWWSLVPAGAAAAAVWLLVLTPDRPGRNDGPSAAELAAYGELFALDDALRGALPLTDNEAVGDLLLIPTPNANHS